MAQCADMPSTSSASVQPDCADDLIFNLPANLLDLSLELPDELNQLGSQSQAPNDPGPSTAEPPPERKRRRKKSKPRPAMPALRSSRGRDLKTTIRYRNDTSKDDHKHWTLPERRRLLAALKEHGSSDVSKLAQAVRTRSAAAVSLFLMDRRRLKDRVVVQRSASKRAAYSVRILRRALNVIRRRYDRSRYLPEVVAACERQPFPEPTEDSIGEVPQFEDLYQMIREVMENHVPAVLGDCELWLFKRLLWTLGNTIKMLDLYATRKEVHKALVWAAAQPPDGYSKPAGQDNEQSQVSPAKEHARHYINFPSMKERKDGLRSSWNPLRMPTSAVQRPWAMIRDYLASNASRRSCMENGAPENGVEGPSASTAAGTTASALASRKKKRKTTTTNEPRTLDAFSAWKN